MKSILAGLAAILLVALFAAPGQAQSAAAASATGQVFHETVTVDGPNGPGEGLDAPTALTVTGGRGADGGITNANSGSGGGVSVTGGDGGSSSQDAGSGGAILLTAGNGGNSSEVGGSGGDITLKPGMARCGALCGLPGNVVLAVPAHGGVGVGVTRPHNTLEVRAGGTTLADAWTVRSSRRFKINIQPLAGALAKVEGLQGVTYQRKSDGTNEIGVIAEDVEKVMPQVVSRDPQTDEVQGVDYARLSALLIEAVKEQQAEIKSLQSELRKLEAEKR